MERHIFFPTIEGECMFCLHAYLHEMVAVGLAITEPAGHFFGECARE